ncbi:response regulator transcription factor [Ktedonospora formicarum]|uniref:DNA-binding response regulator n=1 Tax=Ktedonospora formicarum TaxID=2778364 RepID=A0A8J3MPJ2_9CHLR|nr:response regulator transcription factor [Ktedonospora formicarum]GHO42970.1 DNA-binding response regulator [Ktedonospora formicarum]
MKAKGKRILVVDDEEVIQRVLRKNLLAGGYEVLVAGNGKDALDMVRLHHPDLILLDLCMPGEYDGLDVCIEIRHQGPKPPIIVLSAISEEKQKVKALDLGADDYLTKPFGSEELMARVRVCLRRTQSSDDNLKQAEILVSEDQYLSMDLVRRQVRAGKHEVRLTPTEFELLKQLMLSAGRVLTHRNLLRLVWGPEYGEESDYLRVYVRQLRLKVEETPSHPRYIITEPGIGYVFRGQVVAQNL